MGKIEKCELSRLVSLSYYYFFNMKRIATFLALLSIAVFAQNALTDKRDGKKYKTVKIGEQVWMAQNLNYITKKGSGCKEGKAANCAKYGKLYDWETAMKVCPGGWHFPSDNEWQTLVNFAGDEAFAGKKLKAKSGWDKKSNGDDSYGFSALPSGSVGESVAFSNAGCDGACWWSATESGDMDDAAYGRQVSYDRTEDESDGYSVERFYDVRQAMFSVRCVKD
jgi:uncharacterized protein (TIGR02145 family)